MPKIDELLNSEMERMKSESIVNDEIVVDPITRMMDVPISERLFGVVEDANVEKKYFRCPRYVGDEIDLSKLKIYMKYVHAVGNTPEEWEDTIPQFTWCDDVKVDGDDIVWTWKLSANVFTKKGFMAFAMVAKDENTVAFNTYPAIGTILTTIPYVTEELSTMYPDIVTQLLRRMDSVEAIAAPEAMQNYVNTYLEANPLQLDETLNDSKKAAPSNIVGELKVYLSETNDEFEKFATDISTTNYTLTEITETTIHDKKCIYKDGTLLDVSDNYYVKEYNVNSIKEVAISGSANWGRAFYSFMNEGTILRVSELASNSSDFSLLRTEIVKVPKGASVLYVGYIGTSLKGKAEIADISYQLKPSKKYNLLKWCCLGDSLTEENEKTSKHYFDYVADELGLEVVNCGIGGTGYMRTYENGTAFYQRLDTIPTDCDIITIFGSGNDVGANILGNVEDTGTDTICGCINATIDGIIDRFLAVGKLPIIGVITPTPWKGANDNFKSYCNRIVDICKVKSVPCLNLFECSNLYPNNELFRTLAYSKDGGGGVHPDENGHKIIAPRFREFIETLI